MIYGGENMIPWWGGLVLFIVGAFVGVLMIALMSADRGE